MFEGGPVADFALGDRRIYTATSIQCAPTRSTGNLRSASPVGDFLSAQSATVWESRLFSGLNPSSNPLKSVRLLWTTKRHMRLFNEDRLEEVESWARE